MNSPLYLAITILVSAFLTHILVPPVRRLGMLWGLMDHPSWRRNQTESVPCSGGLAIYVTVLAGAVFLSWKVGIPFSMNALTSLGLAGLGTIVLGLLDDRFGLHAEKKLLGQIVVVSLPMAAGLTLQQISLPFFGSVELGALSGPVTLLWYLGFINSINLIDGLDGLAGGIIVLVLATIAFAVYPHDSVGVFWTLLLLGSVLGFLRNNLSGRRIFLGDAGSMLLGLWLAGFGLGLSAQSSQLPGMMIFAMAVPIMDTSTTIWRRWRKGVSVFRADDEHLHHRFLHLGVSAHRVTISLCFLTLAAASLGAMIYGHPSAGILALGAGAAAAIELAYHLPNAGQSHVRNALAYLLGAKLDLESRKRRIHLAKVIEMPSYHARKKGPDPEAEADVVSQAVNASGEATVVKKASVQNAAEAGQTVDAEVEAEDHVILANSEDPR